MMWARRLQRLPCPASTYRGLLVPGWVLACSRQVQVLMAGISLDMMAGISLVMGRLLYYS